MAAICPRWGCLKKRGGWRWEGSLKKPDVIRSARNKEPKSDYGLVIEPPPLVNSSTERQAHQGSFRAVIFTLSGGKEKMQVSSSR